MQELSGYGLRRALLAGIQRVVARRDEINRINVFPVPDGDTGTNLAFTLSALTATLQQRGSAHAGSVIRRAASEAIDGARGNSGAILAQFFQGMAESLADRARLTPALLAEGAGLGSRLAREALAEPREGTILSVIQAFASELSAQAAQGVRDFRTSFAAALVRARTALSETTRQLAELRAAGVVDAGALGFVDLLEGIDDFIRRGRSTLAPETAADLGEAGVESHVLHGASDVHHYCTECMVSASAVDRGALKAALLALPLASLVLAGTRDKVRVHAHLDDPAQLFETCARFGRVTSQKADDMRMQAESAAQRPERVAIVVDSGADLPSEEMERLNIHMVPVRVSFGARDFLDKVSLSAREFYTELRDSPVPPRTSQPPPGDFRRLFEFLLSHHRQLVYLGIARALSGTLQSGESAAARVDASRAHVLDTRLASAAQGLIAIDAAEAAAAGFDAAAIMARARAMIEQTALHAVVRDISYGVRGGRAPRLAEPLTRLLRFAPTVRNRSSGRLGIAGGIWGKQRLPEKFALRVARSLAPDRRYRVMVCHCDCESDGIRVRETLRAALGDRIERDWLVDAGSGIGAHAGPGSLVIGVQAVVPLDRARVSAA
jgi:hypothetical protein